jgi:hypothetical protein
MINPKMSRFIIFAVLIIVFLGFITHFIVDLLSPSLLSKFFSQDEKQNTRVSQLIHNNLHVEYIISLFILVLIEKSFKNSVEFQVFFSRFITIPIHLRPPVQSKKSNPN